MQVDTPFTAEDFRAIAMAVVPSEVLDRLIAHLQKQTVAFVNNLDANIDDRARNGCMSAFNYLQAYVMDFPLEDYQVGEIESAMCRLVSNFYYKRGFQVDVDTRYGNRITVKWLDDNSLDYDRAPAVADDFDNLEIVVKRDK